jgi:hypothetical protein
VFSSYRSLVLTIIVSRVSSLSALESVLGLIDAEGVLYSGSLIVIITSSLVLSILNAFIKSNIVTTSLRSSSF